MFNQILPIGILEVENDKWFEGTAINRGARETFLIDAPSLRVARTALKGCLRDVVGVTDTSEQAAAFMEKHIRENGKAVIVAVAKNATEAEIDRAYKEHLGTEFISIAPITLDQIRERFMSGSGYDRLVLVPAESTGSYYGETRMMTPEFKKYLGIPNAVKARGRVPTGENPSPGAYGLYLFMKCSIGSP